MNHKLILKEWGNNYKENTERIQPILKEIEQTYAGKRKGIFVSNDTLANVFINFLTIYSHVNIVRLHCLLPHLKNIRYMCCNLLQLQL